MKIGIIYEAVTLDSVKESKACSMSILGFISEIQRGLEKAGYHTEIIGGVSELVSRLKNNIFDCDLVFNAADGTEPGDWETYAPSILNGYGIPYTGSHTSTLSILANKMYTKLIALHYGIKTPEFFLLEKAWQHDQCKQIVEKLKFPIILKANSESGSITLRKANTIQELEDKIQEIQSLTKQPILCETFIRGQELTVPVLGTGANAHALSVLTYRNREGTILDDIFSIPIKYYDCLVCEVAQLDLAILDVAKKYATTIHQETNCVSYSRSDFKVAEDGQVYFLETNPLPDLDPNGAFGIGAQAAGLTFSQVLDFIIKEAIK